MFDCPYKLAVFASNDFNQFESQSGYLPDRRKTYSIQWLDHRVLKKEHIFEIRV